jgi:hypothetical protein
MRIRTRSRSNNGWRRAGVRHTPEPQIWPEDKFTPEQVEQLMKDPEVIVEVLQDVPAVAPAADEQEKPASSGKRK